MASASDDWSSVGASIGDILAPYTGGAGTKSAAAAAASSPSVDNASAAPVADDVDSDGLPPLVWLRPVVCVHTHATVLVPCTQCMTALLL